MSCERNERRNFSKIFPRKGTSVLFAFNYSLEKSDSFEWKKGLSQTRCLKTCIACTQAFSFQLRIVTSSKHKLVKFSWIVDVFQRCDNNETCIETSAKLFFADENRNLFPTRWIASLTKMRDLLMRKLESPIVSWYNAIFLLGEWNIDCLQLHVIFVKVSNNKISNTMDEKSGFTIIWEFYIKYRAKSKKKKKNEIVSRIRINWKYRITSFNLNFYFYLKILKLFKYYF